MVLLRLQSACFNFKIQVILKTFKLTTIGRSWIDIAISNQSLHLYTRILSRMVLHPNARLQGSPERTPSLTTLHFVQLQGSLKFKLCVYQVAELEELSKVHKCLQIHQVQFKLRDCVYANRQIDPLKSKAKKSSSVYISERNEQRATLESRQNCRHM